MEHILHPRAPAPRRNSIYMPCKNCLSLRSQRNDIVWCIYPRFSCNCWSIQNRMVYSCKVFHWSGAIINAFFVKILTRSEILRQLHKSKSNFLFGVLIVIRLRSIFYWVQGSLREDDKFISPKKNVFFITWWLTEKYRL